MHASEKIILFEHASFQLFLKAIVCYMYSTGKYLNSKCCFFCKSDACAGSNQSFCVGGITLFFFLMIFPSCLQNDLCNKESSPQKKLSNVAKYYFNIPPPLLGGNFGVYTIQRSPCPSVSAPDVRLSVHSFPVTQCRIIYKVRPVKWSGADH